MEGMLSQGDYLHNFEVVLLEFQYNLINKLGIMVYG